MGTDTMECEMYSLVRMWPVGVGAVEVEEAGTVVHKPVDSYCLPKPGPPVQVAEVEVHTDTLLRVYRTDNNCWRRVHKSEHSAAAEGVVDTDRMLKHTGGEVDTDGRSAADNDRIGAEVVVGVEDVEEAMMTHTVYDKVEAEAGAKDDERDVPIEAEAPSSDVAVDEWDDAWVVGRDAVEPEVVDHTCDVEPEGVRDSQGQAAAAAGGRWSQCGDVHMSWTNPRSPAQNRDSTPQYSEEDWVRGQAHHHRPWDASNHVHDPSPPHAQAVCG